MTHLKYNVQQKVHTAESGWRQLRITAAADMLPQRHFALRSAGNLQ
jgi:hypothetical protein